MNAVYAGGFGNDGAGHAPAATGSGIGGAVLGGVAGLAAGYGLAKILKMATATDLQEATATFRPSSRHSRI